MAKQNQQRQFMHLELYSRAGNVAAKKTSSGAVINEALRVEGFTDHIISDGYTPKPPTYLYTPNGQLLNEIYDDIEEQVAKEKDALGRKVKSDKNILLAGVASYPKPLAAEWSVEDKQNYILFKEQTLDFLKEKFGDNLRCVIEHTDEQYPHLHFYVVNKQRVASTPELHPGHAENIRLENEAKNRGESVNKREQSAAYKTAMHKFQDDYFNQVSIYCGFDRLGPKVQRLNRQEWKERKRVTKLLAKAFKKVKEQASEVSDKSNALNQSMLELEQQISAVLDMQEKLEKDQQAIDSGVNNLALAEYVRENYKEIVAQFNLQKLRSNIKPTYKADTKKFKD